MRQVKHLLEMKGSTTYSVKPDDPVLTAIREMADKHVGALLVMRGNDLAGIVSERDYARKVILKGRSSADTPVANIMSSPVHTVSPQTTINECMRMMTEQRIRHLPVMENGQVIGMLSIGDLVKAVITDQQEHIEQLQKYITS